MSFVHLHVHSHYSLLDGAMTVDQIVDQTKELGMPAVALTEHGNMFGAIEFYDKAVKAGIRPILGCEIYLVPRGTMRDREGKGDLHLNHLVVLALDESGYRNLCWLISQSYLHGFYWRPRLDKETLAAHAQGLVALSGCPRGEIPRLIGAGDLEGARRVAEGFAQIFPGRFYIEVQDHGSAGGDRLRSALRDLSRTMGLPLVATNDCHYLYRENASAHDALLAIGAGQTVESEDRFRFETSELYLKSPDLMCELFRDCPEACEATLEIARQITLEFDFGRYSFPKVTVPEGRTIGGYLEELVMNGMDQRWPAIVEKHPHHDADSLKKLYRDRIASELETIRRMGFEGYFLIVWDFIGYARRSQIPVGPGRGSAAGSLVAYCLQITDIDPIPYGLLFERFLNPERISMPDMDIDFCMERRDEVIRYVTERYGNVCQIITFGKMKAKAVVRDVGRVLNIPFGEVDRIAKLIPTTLGITLKEAMAAEPRLGEAAKESPKVMRCLTIAQELEGLARHASTHAAGVVIADRDLTELMPLYRGPEGERVTGFDMKAVERIGLIKFDFLGLKTLTVLDQALKIIRRTRGEEIDLSRIPLNDPQVYALLSRGDTAGIFQLESAGMRDLIVKLKPSCFEDLIALVALYRPGPLGSGMVEDFIARKHGRVESSYELEELREILKETYGVIVYQEQVMQLASRLAHFSLGEADILRRAMGKKNLAEMQRQKERFIEGCLRNRIPRRKAVRIFELMDKFASYGFNKSHSAAYAMITYQTAWLKARYRVEMMASLLSYEIADTDKVIVYIRDSREHRLAVLPPDVNESYSGFSVVSPTEIRFGLAAVKGVGSVAVQEMVAVRKEGGSFKSVADFCGRIDSRRINRRVVESLIKCGAFDSLDPDRGKLFGNLSELVERGTRQARERTLGQTSLTGLWGEAGDQDEASADAGGHVVWGEREKLAFEKEALGFYITGHPFERYVNQAAESGCIPIERLRTAEDRGRVKIAGTLTARREIFTRRGERMAFVTLEDLTGRVEVVLFPESYARARAVLGSEALMVQGSLDKTEEGVKVLGDRVLSLDEEGFSEVHIYVRSPVVPDQWVLMRKALEHFRGERAGFLHLTGGEGTEVVMELPQGLCATDAEGLKESLERAIGAVEIRVL